MYTICVGVAFLIGLANKDILTVLCVGIKDYRFKEKSPTILNNTQFRFADTGWSHVTSILTCARRAVVLDPEVRGYVFDPGSGVCTPLLWLRERPGYPSSGVPTGLLYLRPNSLCPLAFQMIQYGGDQQETCIFKITPPMTYDLATSHCISMGGFLASVRTLEKLAVVEDFADGKNMWVGLDDLLKEGQWVWQEDNSKLTRDVQGRVFSSGEPNGWLGNEDCVEFKWSTKRLNDVRCHWNNHALCEAAIYY